MARMFTVEIPVTLVTGEVRVPLMATFAYNTADPYAVRMAFFVGVAEPVEWFCGRELLNVGQNSRVGEADIKIWPATNLETGEPITCIKLSSPFGEARFEAPAARISAFLRRSYALIPAEHESDVIDMDSELRGLLGDGS